MTDVPSNLVEINPKTDAVVLTVEQLNRQIRQLIEGELSLVWVQGEISNFKAHSSGHFYFSLKDSKSQIKAVMFRGHNSRLRFKPHDGLEVLIRGRVTVYEPRGDYQIACEMMEPVGSGALQKAFEQLKLKLKSEGLFETTKKRPLPSFPRHVVIVSSPTGAAIRDMISVLSRRNKTVQVTLIPTIVQGEAAAPKIIEALSTAYKLPNVDVIIVGRGGGSIEDMWCFNDEKLARIIAASPVPIISAVGHEIDFTIADFVADLRAPTPSAAAELVVKSSEELFQKLTLVDRLLFVSMEKKMRADLHRLKSIVSKLVDPKRKLQDLTQRNDELHERLNLAVFRYFEKRKMGLKLIVQSLPSPEQIIQENRNEIETAATKLRTLFSQSFESRKFKLKNAMTLLDGLSPLRVVERGYSMTMRGKTLIKNSNQVNIGDEISIVLMKGRIEAKVVSTN